MEKLSMALIAVTDMTLVVDLCSTNGSTRNEPAENATEWAEDDTDPSEHSSIDFLAQ